MTTDPKAAVLDVRVGRVYCAKKPRDARGLINDRQVLHISSFGEVQYDSPTVGFARHYPKVSVEKFRAWADRDVTDLMPKGGWRPYAAKRLETP